MYVLLIIFYYRIRSFPIWHRYQSFVIPDIPGAFNFVQGLTEHFSAVIADCRSLWITLLNTFRQECCPWRLAFDKFRSLVTIVTKVAAFLREDNLDSCSVIYWLFTKL